MTNGPALARWSGLNIALHWLIVALIIAQWLEGEYMSRLWDATLEHRSASQFTAVLGYTHLVFGCLILAAALIRLVDRWTYALLTFVP